MRRRTLVRLVAAAAAAAGCATALAAGNLNVVNWSNYFIGPEAVNEFGRAENININYATLDSDDTLQAKLLSGHSGYDVVYPSSAYVRKQIDAGAFQELDWSKIPNRVNLDPALLKLFASQDPGNRYGVPNVWGTVGMTVNVTRARQMLGNDAPLETWDLLFKPEVVSKLHRCGVSIVDQASDVLPHVLAYLGRNPNSRDPADYRDAFALLKKVRPYIDQFNSNTYISDMVGGDICIALGWSGDAGMIRRRALKMHQPFEIRYVAPKGQTGLWATLMMVPKDAPNKDNAYKWINHMIDVKIAAGITNVTTYPTAVPAAAKLLSPEIAADAANFPSADHAKDFFFLGAIEPELMRTITRGWLEFKAGQ